jgi:hypothetical protein
MYVGLQVNTYGRDVQKYVSKAHTVVTTGRKYNRFWFTAFGYSQLGAACWKSFCTTRVAIDIS